MRGDLQEGHCYASRAQKPHFCVKTTKNLGKIAHSDTKTAILCSAGLTEQHGAAQRSTEQHGAARRGREQPLETGQDRLERSATARSTTKRNLHETQPQRNEHNTRNATQHTQRNTMQHTQRNRSVTHNATARATPRNRHATAQQKRRQPFGLSPLKIGGYLLSHMVVQYHRRK